MVKGANQEKKSASDVLTMDARKLLRTINEGVSAKLSFFTKQVQRLGEKQNKKFRLVSLNKNSLIYEDVESNSYFLANVKKSKGNRYSLDGIKNINIVEGEKDKDYSSFCSELVEAIAKEDFQRADASFKKIEASRFRSTVLPESGNVRAKDGSVHHIKLSDRVLPEDRRAAIASAISEAIMDRYDVTVEGDVISAYFSDNDKIVLPSTSGIRHRAAARRMRGIALEAWQKTGFQKFIKTIASLVSKHKLEEAIEESGKFLREYQEFCLLSEKELHTVVENALFSSNVMNGILAEHTSKLIYRSNMKFNKDDIVETWSNIAKKIGSSPMMEAVSKLSDSETFSEDYERVLQLIDEKTDVDTTLLALRLSKQALVNQGEATDDDYISDIDNLINRLESNERADRAAREEAEEILAGVESDVIGRAESLEDFDTIPGAAGEEELVAPEGAVEDLDGGDDLGLDIGGDDLGGEGDDLGLDMEGGEDDLGLEGEDIGGEDEEDDLDLDLNLESKNADKLVKKLTKIYENITKNYDKVLSEKGPSAMLQMIDGLVAKAAAAGEKAANVKAAYSELQAELADMADDVGADMADPMADPMAMGGDDYALPAPDGEGMDGSSEVDIDFGYTGDEPAGDDVAGAEGADDGAPPPPPPSDGEDADDDEGGFDDEEGEEGDEPEEFEDEAGEADNDDDDDSEEVDESTEGKGVQKKTVKVSPDLKEDQTEFMHAKGNSKSARHDAQKDIKAEKEDEKEEVDEDQYKWPTARHGQGEHSGYGRSSINAVEEWTVSGKDYSLCMGDDDNFWLKKNKLNEAVCIGDGAGEFDFDLGSKKSYYNGAMEWMRTVASGGNGLAEHYWKKAITVLEEGELPDFIKDKQKDKKDDKDEEVDETHETGMHGKSDSSVKMQGGDGKMMENAHCPVCSSSQVIVMEDTNAKCSECGAVGDTSKFVAEDMVDPSSDKYTTKKPAQSWGDGKKRNDNAKVEKGNESGDAGVSAPKSSKKPAIEKSGNKDVGQHKGYMKKD